MESMNQQPQTPENVTSPEKSPEKIKREAALSVARIVIYGIELGKNNIRSFIDNGKEHAVEGSGVPSLAAMRAMAQFYLKEAESVHAHLVSNAKH